jgi:purine-nucleoside phosphorylase
MFEHIEEAVKAIRSRSELQPSVGVVLGSGLGAFSDRIEDACIVPYGTIPHFPTSHVEGHRGELVVGHIQGTACAVMSGRVHYYEGYSMEKVTFPMRVLKALGVTKIVITNAAGASNPDFEPGDFMVIKDHLNLTGDNPLRGPNDGRFGERFPDMSQAYCERGINLLHEVAQDLGHSLREGIYAGLAGPSYETPAEVRMLRTLGADAVGMSTVAEVIVAQHAKLEVAGVSVITNRAAGLSATPLSHAEVKEVGAMVEGPLCELLSRVVSQF